jgi:hypothetical protein
MKYYVENWETEEVIAEFDTAEERQAWFKKNATLIPSDGAYLEDGTHIAFYEF